MPSSRCLQSPVLMPSLLSLCCCQHSPSLLQNVNHNAKEEDLPCKKDDTRADVLQTRDVAMAEGYPELVHKLP